MLLPLPLMYVTPVVITVELLAVNIYNTCTLYAQHKGFSRKLTRIGPIVMHINYYTVTIPCSLYAMSSNDVPLLRKQLLTYFIA